MTNEKKTLQSIAASTRAAIASDAEIPERVRVLSGYSWDNLIPIAMQAGIDPDDDPHMSKAKLAQEIYIAETVGKLSATPVQLHPYSVEDFVAGVYRIKFRGDNKRLCIIFSNDDGERFIYVRRWYNVQPLGSIIDKIIGYDLITVSQ